MWHFRRGGMPQLRQWTARKLGAEYAINYARLLDENQRKLQNELHSFKEIYDNDFSAVNSSQEQIAASIWAEVQKKFVGIVAKQDALERRSKELQDESLAEIKADYQSKLNTIQEDCNGLIGRLEDQQQRLAEQRAVIQELQARSQKFASDHEALTRENRRLRATVFSNATRTGLNPELELEDGAFRPLVQELTEQEDTLPIVKLAENLVDLQALNLTELRRLGRLLNAAGYWRLLAGVQELIFAKSKKNTDRTALDRTLSTMAVFRAPLGQAAHQSSTAYNPSGPVIHVAGKGLLDAQTGYTLRTAYTVRAQQQLGISTLVVLQPGSSEVVDSVMKRITFENVEYVRLPGKPRGRSLLSQWLEEYIDELERLVLDEKPSVLHAHSDFLNGAAALVVGRRTGVPVIYESRGFWEESWMSRIGDKLGLGLEPEKTLRQFGLPEAYTLRQQAEHLVREGADAVITLADVMKDHIGQAHAADGIGPVHVVPNAVDPSEFKPHPVDIDLACTLKIPKDAVTIGYVTSMVEYEGIDVLLKAFAQLQNKTKGQKTHLLLVGDGPVLDRLKTLAEDLGVVKNVTFTGRVPHEEVWRYYSLIEVFVVPRRPTTVSQLVTPLKPFEAMSMAKAVVVSGVSALQEIATKSEAAYSFVPNDHVDLASVLDKLVQDEDLRRELGQRARGWVADHRSWAINAQNMLDIYRSLGADWPHVLGGSDTSWEETIAQYLKVTPPPQSGWFVLDEPQDSPETIMQGGWRYRNYPRIKLDQHIDWGRYPEKNRSLAFWLQSWVFFDAFLAQDRVLSVNEIRFLLGIVRRWETSRNESLDSSEFDDSMFYYDMALALRVPRLLALISVVENYAETRSEAPWLIRILLRERQALQKAEAFAPHTNHGFYTACAQLHVEKFFPELPDHDRVLSQAMERMDLLIRTQFGEDGGHLEHSPGYHFLLLNSFMSAVDEGLIVDSTLVSRLYRAKHVLGWMIQPDGSLVPMGDTDPSQMSSSVATDDSHAQWIMTDGKQGRPISSELLVLPDSGYVFIRTPQPEEAQVRIESSYLALQGGFHSRAHKHADDLSFVWFDRGQEILLDAGQWGYGPLLPPNSSLRDEGHYYAAPERQYIESVRAHNTVEINGRIHDRRRPPYGSAILHAEQVDEAFIVNARAAHAEYFHNRQMRFQPGQRLAIHDLVETSTDEKCCMTIWFLLNGNFELLEHEKNVAQFLMPSGDKIVLRSSVSFSAPIIGQQEPLRGWRSAANGSLQPAWSIAIESSFLRTGSIETVYEIIR